MIFGFSVYCGFRNHGQLFVGHFLLVQDFSYLSFSRGLIRKGRLCRIKSISGKKQ